MRYKNQQKYFDTLKRYERKMDPKELEDYRMLLQRHRSEEELDSLSLSRLENLYIKYYVNRDRRDLDNFFRKQEDDKNQDH